MSTRSELIEKVARELAREAQCMGPNSWIGFTHDAQIAIAATIQGLLEVPLPEEASTAAENAENFATELTPRGMHEAEFRAMLGALRTILIKETS